MFFSCKILFERHRCVVSKDTQCIYNMQYSLFLPYGLKNTILMKNVSSGASEHFCSSHQAVAATRSLTALLTGKCQTFVRMTCWHDGRLSASHEPPYPLTSTCPTRATRVDICQRHYAKRATTKRREDARAGVPPLHLQGVTDLLGRCNTRECSCDLAIKKAFSLA